jgi:hypothetical protein
VLSDFVAFEDDQIIMRHGHHQELSQALPAWCSQQQQQQPPWDIMVPTMELVGEDSKRMRMMTKMKVQLELVEGSMYRI